MPLRAFRSPCVLPVHFDPRACLCVSPYCREMGIMPLLGRAPPDDEPRKLNLIDEWRTPKGGSAAAWGEEWAAWAAETASLSSTANMAPFRDSLGDFHVRWKLMLVLASTVMMGQSYDARERVALHAIATRLVPELTAAMPAAAPTVARAASEDAGTDVTVPPPSSDGAGEVKVEEPAAGDASPPSSGAEETHNRLAAVEQALAVAFARSVLTAETKRKCVRAGVVRATAGVAVRLTAVVS